MPFAIGIDIICCLGVLGYLGSFELDKSSKKTYEESVKHSIPHDLDVVMAKQVAQKAIAYYQHKFARFNPAMVWQTDTQVNVSFRAKGVSLNGYIIIKPHVLEIEVATPLVLKLFEKRAVARVDQEARQWISEAKAAALGTHPGSPPEVV